MSVFTIKYFGLSMRAAHLKAAVKEQVLSYTPFSHSFPFPHPILSLSSLFSSLVPLEISDFHFLKMCRKLAKDLQAELLEYTKNFVIVEMMEHSHRVVSRRYE